MINECGVSWFEIMMLLFVAPLIISLWFIVGVMIYDVVKGL